MDPQHASPLLIRSAHVIMFLLVVQHAGAAVANTKSGSQVKFLEVSGDGLAPLAQLPLLSLLALSQPVAWVEGRSNDKVDTVFGQCPLVRVASHECGTDFVSVAPRTALVCLRLGGAQLSVEKMY